MASKSTPYSGPTTVFYDSPLYDSDERDSPLGMPPPGYTGMSSVPPSTNPRDRVGFVTFEGSVVGPKVEAEFKVGDPDTKLYSYAQGGIVYSISVKDQQLGFTEAQWLEIIHSTKQAMQEEKIPGNQAFSLDLSQQTFVTKAARSRSQKPAPFKMGSGMQTLFKAIEKHGGFKIKTKASSLQGRAKPHSPSHPSSKKTQRASRKVLSSKKKSAPSTKHRPPVARPTHTAPSYYHSYYDETDSDIDSDNIDSD